MTGMQLCASRNIGAGSARLLSIVGVLLDEIGSELGGSEKVFLACGGKAMLQGARRMVGDLDGGVCQVYLFIYERWGSEIIDQGRLGAGCHAGRGTLINHC